LLVPTSRIVAPGSGTPRSSTTLPVIVICAIVKLKHSIATIR